MKGKIYLFACLIIVSCSFIYADYLNCNMTLANQTGLTTNNQSVCGVANTNFVYDSFFNNITDTDFSNWIEFYGTNYSTFKFYVNYTLPDGITPRDILFQLPFKNRVTQANFIRQASCSLGSYTADLCNCVNHSIESPSKLLKLYVVGNVASDGAGIYCIDTLTNLEYPIMAGATSGSRVRSLNLIFWVNETNEISPPENLITGLSIDDNEITGLFGTKFLGLIIILFIGIILFFGLKEKLK